MKEVILRKIIDLFCNVNASNSQTQQSLTYLQCLQTLNIYLLRICLICYRGRMVTSSKTYIFEKGTLHFFSRENMKNKTTTLYNVN